jgi:hypothetical protein
MRPFSTAAAGATRFVVLLSIAATVHGCLGYRLGTTLPEGIRSIHVPTFVNECGEPDLEFTVTQATIREFRRDGSLKIAAAEEADAILEATLKSFELKPLRYSSDNATEANEYRLTLTVSIALKEKGTGRTLTENTELQGDSTFELEGDIALAKTAALPAAARDLAHDIVESVVEAW